MDITEVKGVEMLWRENIPTRVGLGVGLSDVEFS